MNSATGNTADGICEAVRNEKQFKVIRVSRKRFETTTGQPRCVCDNCLQSPDIGYYVAVLNRWLCPQCFHSWYVSGINYPEDRRIEAKNFTVYGKLLGLDV